MSLTDTAIKALKPKDKAYVVADGRGLYLEVMPSGTKAWRYRYYLNGKQEKVSLGLYPATSLKSARQKHAEYAELVAGGQSPARRKQQAKSDDKNQTTVKGWGERYYNDVVKRVRKNPDATRRYLTKEIYPRLGSKDIRKVTTNDVRTLVFTKRDEGFEAAAGEIRGLLKRLFDYAMARGIVDINPAAAIPNRFVTTSRPRDRVLSTDEIRIYLQTVYQSNMRRQFKLALHLILLTMVRKSELLHARWEDVDFEQGEWQIPQPNSKTRKPHIVYLSRQAVAMLQELRKLAGSSELVLPGRKSPHKPFAHNALNFALNGLAIPIPAFTLHDLRRTASTLLHEAGYPSDVVEKALNHTIGGSRGVYNRAEYRDQRKEMLQFWADTVDDLMTEQKVILGQFRKAL